MTINGEDFKKMAEKHIKDVGLKEKKKAMKLVSLLWEDLKIAGTGKDDS